MKEITPIVNKVNMSHYGGITPKGAIRARIKARDEAAALKTAQLWARLRTNSPHSDDVYWVKSELRKRGYCV
jgi:hypothetical protein